MTDTHFIHIDEVTPDKWLICRHLFALRTLCRREKNNIYLIKLPSAVSVRL